MLRGNLAGKVTKVDRFMAHNGTFDAPPNLKETVPEKADFLQWLEVAPAEQKRWVADGIRTRNNRNHNPGLCH
jgi:hypothetical protein